MPSFKNLKSKKVRTHSFGRRSLIAVLVISLIAGTGALRVWQGSAAAYTCTSTAATVSYCNANYDAAIHSRINLIRTNAGLNAVRRSTGCLEDFARASAKRMATNKSMTHATNLKEAINRCGLTLVSENIAAGFNDPVVLCRAWYDSPTHKANMMRPRVNVHAIASYKSTTGKIYTASWLADTN